VYIVFRESQATPYRRLLGVLVRPEHRGSRCWEDIPQKLFFTSASRYPAVLWASVVRRERVDNTPPARSGRVREREKA
jgi:hypothetical protein